MGFKVLSHQLVTPFTVVAGFRGTPGYKGWAGYTGTLTNGSGLTPLSNTTYTGMDFPGGLDIGSTGTPLSNTVFRGCRFHGVNVDDKLVGLWGDGIVLDQCTFDPGFNPPVAHANSYQYGIAANGGFGTHVAALMMIACEGYGWGNMVDTEGSTQSKPQVFQDCWFHDAADDGGDYHTDGIGTESGGNGSYIVIDHCTIESLGNTNALAFQAPGTYDHFTITNNKFGGFGYTIAILDGATNITFTDNVFSTELDIRFGPLYPDTWWTDAKGSTWRRNKWLVPSGAAWGTPGNSGKFWIPAVIDVTNGDTDNLCTSTSDYAGS